MGVEVLDLTQLHCIPTEQMRRGDVFDWLRALRDAGKIKPNNTAFPENDHRTFNRDGPLFNVGETFAGLPFEQGVELADAMKPTCRTA